MDFGFYNIDCMQGMKEFPDKYFDLSIVDPPYGLGFVGKWDIRPHQDYFIELFRISKDQIIFGGNFFNLPITEGWICWNKTINGKTYLKERGNFELLWTSLNIKATLLNYTFDGNIHGFNGGKPNYKKPKPIHPSQKPEMVYRWLVKNYAQSGWKLLDTHVGSASSLIAFEQEGFDYVGFEIDTYYYNVAVKRLETWRNSRTLDLFEQR